MKKLKLFISLLTITAMLFVALSNIVSAAERDFMEMDEISESGYPALAGATISAKSALRVGNTGTGANDFTTITAPYNEPRNSSSNPSGVRAHKGTDFRSIDSSGNGRKLFFVYDNGEVYQIESSLNSSGYGRYVLAQHKHVQNSTNYYFQTFYAHLKSVDSALKVGGSVSSQDAVGISGGSGTKEDSYPVHLHLEFRGASSTKSTSTKRYPTNFFYSGQGEYGLNMAFINRVAASSTSVTFRIVSVYQGSERYVPEDKVVLYYKNGNMTSWASTTMTRSSDKKNFTKDLTSLYGTSNTLSYYVKASTDSYDGTNFYYTHRPYRYTDGTAPTDRPFTVTKSSGAAGSADALSQTSDIAQVVDQAIMMPDVVNTVKYDQIQTVTLVSQLESDQWEVATDAGETFIMKINYINAAPALSTGEKILIAGHYVPAENSKQIIVVDGDNIRVFDEMEE